MSSKDPLIPAFENVLPKYLLAYLADALIAKGLIIRSDVQQALTVGFAAAPPPKGFRRSDMIAKLEGFSSNFIRQIVADTPQTAFIGGCTWVLDLIDQKLFDDPGSTAGASAVMFVEEAQQDDGVWMVHWPSVEQTRHKLMAHCRMNGLYLRKNRNILDLLGP